MVSLEAIIELGEQIAREFHPQRIILFGSYAAGTAHEGSDVDLLVILPFRGNGIRKAIQILDRVDPHFPVDLLARTPQNVKRRLAWNDFFLREVMEKGRVLYSRPKGKGR
ncbi:MAG: nucleotidyltransferase domain-containing protein [Planctomycetota bacterium]